MGFRIYHYLAISEEWQEERGEKNIYEKMSQILAFSAKPKDYFQHRIILTVTASDIALATDISRTLL